ncbi:DnaB-like helicase C-terminal domain-containing protein [Chlorobium phaeovibrioides]|uniref:Toprim domain-containing protein n=1 Tax=Chlorobium phaeovibrioides TaxID=1094 RepID=A0A5M8I4Q0_CHLPH|nr:DnaB-like helicase C-terminal domain-containing protein [Chlorobium phaeovibrioides]KAA6230373.1 toprim domain-containing protein [Chlorobium phaeovibrioides]MWV54983.1 toprim domain-containing protein [Chlorobium phaeovibrioides]
MNTTPHTGTSSRPNPATLRPFLRDYVESITTRSKGGFHTCPLCGSGNGPKGTAAFSIADDGEHWKCFACNKGGDLFDLIGEHESRADFADRMRRAVELFGSRATSPQPAPKAAAPEQPRQVVDFTPFIEQARRAISRTDYPQRRGLTAETIERFGLGYYDPAERAAHDALVGLYGYDPIQDPALIIPYPGTGYFITRRIDPQGGRGSHHKPKAEKAGDEPLFNIEALYNPAGAPVFITEAPLDAISIMQAGGLAVAASGTNRRRLLKALDKRAPSCTIIIAGDQDEQGQVAAAELAADLKERGIKHTRPDLFNGTGAKDANDLLQRDPAGLTLAIRAAIHNTAPEHFASNAAARLRGFLHGITESVNTPCIPTGFPKLDELLDGGLYEGLYAIGAVSSMGKTTFALQVADYMAKAGQDVLFFSLEMSANEIIAKSISRLTFEHCGGYSGLAKTSRGITSGKRHQGYSTEEMNLLKRAIHLYEESYAPRLYFIEGVGDIGVTQIRATVEKHITLTGRKPVVVIDYLQALAPYNERATDKQNIDKGILELKRISRDEKIPVIAISSFNRANYHGAAGLEAFKESGAIEYTADVVLAIQPEGVNHGSEGKDKKENKKAMHDYKSKEERRGEVVILKNRNGATNKAVTVAYKAMFNHFRELDSKEYIEPDNEPTPF